jgi:predicted hydrolase (HD superfamily)
MKSYDMGPQALSPPPGKNVCCEFLSPLKIIASAGYEPSNFGSNGKHAKHYTTQVTKNVMELQVLFLVDAYYILHCMTANNEMDCYFQEWGRQENSSYMFTSGLNENEINHN